MKRPEEQDSEAMHGRTDATGKHRAAVRESLRRIHDPMLAMMDACRDRFGAKAEGVQGALDGQIAGAGRFGPNGDLNRALAEGDPSWARWLDGQR